MSASLAVLVVVTGACGDDSVKTLSKEDYVTQANAICAKTSDVVDPAFVEILATISDLDGPVVFVEEWDTLFDEIVTPAVNEEMVALRALPTPEGDADLLAALYDEIDQALDEYNATLDGATAGDPDAVASISSGSAELVFNDVNQRARDYGLTVCGEQDE